MRKTNIFAALFAGASVLVSCGTLGTTQNNGTQTGSALSTVLGAVASSALSGATSSVTSTVQQQASSALSSVNTGSLISGILGYLTNGMTSSASIVGTWSYAEPTVQFQSENFLAQAGGIVAATTITDKLKPYYEKVGIKEGVMTATFNQDGTCTITLGQTPISGIYTYDSSTNTVQIKSQLGLTLVTAYTTVSSNQLALTLDSSKLLVMATALGATSNNSTTKTISSLAAQYSGMKTGFLFNRK